MNMNVNIIDKPKKNINGDIKISKSSDVIKVKEVQAIRRAIREHLLFIGTDIRNNIRNISLLGIGTSNNIIIDSKEIVRIALLTASDKVILVHNHPSNSLEPSKEDIHITNITKEILKPFNIQLLDHIIITEKDYISMTKIEENNQEHNNKCIEKMQKGLLMEENILLKHQIEELEQNASSKRMNENEL